MYYRFDNFKELVEKYFGKLFAKYGYLEFNDNSHIDYGVWIVIYSNDACILEIYIEDTDAHVEIIYRNDGMPYHFLSLIYWVTPEKIMNPFLGNPDIDKKIENEIEWYAQMLEEKLSNVLMGDNSWRMTYRKDTLGF
ncbi:MAG: hypothetical protein V4613_00740 [Bacteroidota bacterium]